MKPARAPRFELRGGRWFAGPWVVTEHGIARWLTDARADLAPGRAAAPLAEQVARAVEWLLACTVPAPRSDPARAVEALKVETEAWSGCAVSPGAIIVAALELGLALGHDAPGIRVRSCCSCCRRSLGPKAVRVLRAIGTSTRVVCVPCSAKRGTWAPSTRTPPMTPAVYRLLCAAAQGRRTSRR